MTCPKLRIILFYAITTPKRNGFIVLKWCMTHSQPILLPFLSSTGAWAP